MTNVYYLKWYGPFNSVEDLKEWQNNEREDCYLYLLQGKRLREQKYTYYCGQAFKQDVEKRLSNKGHHIEELKDRSEHLSIWIGAYGNKRKPTKADVNLCEKMLTSEMMQVEIDDANTANETNIKAPSDDVIIFNEWYNLKKEHRERTPKESPANRIPDVISYWAETKEVFATKHLKKIGSLK